MVQNRLLGVDSTILLIYYLLTTYYLLLTTDYLQATRRRLYYAVEPLRLPEGRGALHLVTPSYT